MALPDSFAHRPTSTPARDDACGTARSELLRYRRAMGATRRIFLASGLLMLLGGLGAMAVAFTTDDTEMMFGFIGGGAGVAVTGLVSWSAPIAWMAWTSMSSCARYWASSRTRSTPRSRSVSASRDPLSLVPSDPSRPRARTTIVTIARPAIQPPRKARLFDVARFENSIRIRAMIGTGLIATPTAKPRI